MWKRARFALTCLILGSLLVPTTALGSAGRVQPTPGAERVRSYGAVPNDGRDDTRAFQEAIAAAAHHRIRAGGPNGNRQGVVYVAPGHYRVCGVRPRSNVRLEVDAGAVLLVRPSGCSNSAAILLGGGVRNVSLVGVGSSRRGKPRPHSNRRIAQSFTINTDPAVTHATSEAKAVAVRWVTSALIARVITVQNDSRTASHLNTPRTSNSPAITFYGEPGSTRRNPRLPHHILVRKVYNVHSPVSYGAIQVSACVRCRFNHVFSQGGVALRLETDAEEAYYLRTGRHYYSTVNALRANDIEGYNGRQALTFSPHSQRNGTVTVTKVIARSTYAAVRLANVRLQGGLHHGRFSSLSLVKGVITHPGTDAQIQMPGSAGWWTGPSRRAIDDAATSFEVRFRQVHCGGLKSSSPCL